MTIRTFSEVVSTAPVSRAEISQVSITTLRREAQIGVSGGRGQILTLCLCVDADDFTDPSLQLELGWELSEDGGGIWELLASSRSEGGLILDGKDELSYRHLFVTFTFDKARSFLVRPFMVASKDMILKTVSWWMETNGIR